jgi:hypothetical protein
MPRSRSRPAVFGLAGELFVRPSVTELDEHPVDADRTAALRLLDSAGGPPGAFLSFMSWMVALGMRALRQAGEKGLMAAWLL